MSDFPVTPMLRQFEALTPAGTDPTVHLRQISISFGERMESSIVRRAWDVVAGATPVLAGSLSGGEDSPGVWTDLDWAANPPDDLGVAWAELRAADARQPFAAGVTQRIVMLRLPGDTLHFLWTSDARALDYASACGTLIRWFAACDLLMSGNPVQWPPDEDPSDFLAKLTERPMAADQDFWNSRFRDAVAERRVTMLPLPANTAATRESVTFTLERVDRLALREGADAMDAPMSAVGRAAWALLLAGACGAGDVVIAESLEAEPDSILSQTAGRFESWVPRRIVIPETGDVGAFARACADLELGSARYFTADEIAAAANVSVDFVRPAGAYVFRDGSLNDQLQRALPRWMAADVCLYEKAAHPLTLIWTDTDRPTVEISFDPSVISSDAAASLLRRWVHLVNQFANAPEQSISAVSLALPGEEVEVRGHEVPSSARSLVPQCLHEAFADVANELGDRAAVELGVESFSFSKLATQSNQLSRYLVKIGVKSGDTVAVSLSRAPWWLVALLGVWKSGARVQLSGSTPMSGVSALIVDATTATHVEAVDGVKRIAIDSGWSSIHNEKTRGAAQSVDPKAAAIVFRSGDAQETVLSHIELLAACYATGERLGLGVDDRMLHFGSTDTAAGIEEAFAGLLSGATLVLRPDDVWSTRTAFHEFVADAKISALALPTAFWGMWLHYLSELSSKPSESLRMVALTGWRVLPAAVRQWTACAPGVALLHGTAWRGLSGLGFCTRLDGSDTEVLPFGYLASPVVRRIVNSRGVALPMGFGGTIELAIQGNEDGPPGFDSTGLSGHGASDGAAISTPWLLASRGVTPPNPALQIEWVASAHPGIASAVAELRETDGVAAWCVWIVPNEVLRGEPLDFRDWMRARLPEWLVPGRIGCLQRLPLDRHGNVDLVALPEPNSELPDSGSRQTRGTDEEEQLRSVLSKVLGGRHLRLDEMIRDGRNRPQVAQSLMDAVAQSGHTVELGDFTSPFSVRSLLRSVRSRRTVTESGWVPLKPLRVSGNQPPLVLIHDFSGNSRSCEALASALGDDQPCYAITARGLADAASCHSTVEEMASAYLDAVRTLDPEGPYGFVGIGFGGLVAYEIARTLDAAGTPPRFLAVLRTEPPETSVAKRGLRAISAGFFKTLGGLGGGSNPSASGDPNRRKSAPNPVADTNRDAAAKYSPEGTASFPMHVFVPERDFPAFREVEAGWIKFSSDAQFYQVPCAASELLDEPVVSAVGTALAKLARFQDLADDLTEDEAS